MDLKYGLTSGLTLDLTLNPEFSYVEVEVKKKVNLTTFPDSFPEKRAFFVENAGLFQLGRPTAWGLAESQKPAFSGVETSGSQPKENLFPSWAVRGSQAGRGPTT